MKQIMSLIMLLLLSSPLISQVISTNPTNCLIPNSQVDNIYKGLKQGEYLKIRLDKTDKTLIDATNIMGEQKKIIDNLTQKDLEKDKIINNITLKCSQEKELKDIEIIRLQDTMDLNLNQAKKQSRRKATSSFLLGAGIGITVSAVAVLLLLN